MKFDEWQPTRHTLLHRLKDHEDATSWQEFFNRYWRFIYSVALHAGLREDEAQDVVQETIISVSKTIGDFKYDRTRCTFKSWLVYLTKCRIADHLRKRARQPSAEPLLGGHNGHNGDDTPIDPLGQIADPSGLVLDGVWDQEWRNNLLAAALDAAKEKVTAQQFQIFHSYVVKGWPVKQVAQALGVNAGQVYLAKHRVGAVVNKEMVRLEKESEQGTPQP